MGYTLAGALEALRKLCEYGIIYAEQPVATIEDMAALRFAIAKEGLPARIAADESIRKAEDPLKVARANAADLMVIKAAPLGGVRRALALVEQAQLPAVVSSALELRWACHRRLASGFPADFEIRVRSGHGLPHG